MAKESKAEKIKRLKKSYAQWEKKKKLAYNLAKFYYDGAYKVNNDIPSSSSRTEGTKFGWYAGTTAGTTSVKKRGAVVNSPSFHNMFYPDGKDHGPITIYAVTLGTAAVLTWTSFSFNKVTTRSVDPERVYASALVNKDAHDRHAYMNTQYKTVISAAMSEIESQLNDLGVSDTEIATLSTGTGTGATGGDNGGSVHNYSKDTLETNVGMVKEAYFSQEPGFTKLANLMSGGSLPHDVSSADKLWKDSQSNKGMLWLYVPTNPAKDSYTIVPSAAGKEEYNQYIFQFHYNPPTVQMAWQGNPNVDVTMESSGTEKFNNMSSSTTSAISFDIILNRMYDLQYYGSDGLLKDGYKVGENGHPYIAKSPTTDEQKDIYNKGTMYDVEHLLGTALGFKLNTRLRGKTTDIGYLTGRPVDLHLGNHLRYWGYITTLNLEHRIFDERMVPIFSTVHIEFARVPDYGGKK